MPSMTRSGCVLRRFRPRRRKFSQPSKKKSGRSVRLWRPSSLVVYEHGAEGMSQIIRGTIFAAVLAIAGPAAAQQYPAGKPIEMTVMFGAGSASDMTARHLADGMAKHLGAPVPVVNRTGGGGALGYVHVSQQKPDGYSIVWNSNSISTTYHAGQLPMDYKAFDPVARVTVENPVLAVKASSPFKTLKDLVDYAKANPEK